MKIISPFHDYYDSAMGLGVDRSLVFVRQPGELSEAEGSPFAIDPGPDYMWYAKDWSLLARARPFWVAVAGKRFNGLEVQFREECGIGLASGGYHAYDMASLESALATYGLELPSADRHTRGRTARAVEQSLASTLRRDLDEWFGARDTDLSSAMAAAGVSILAQRDKAGAGHRTWDHRMHLRPSDLASIEFNPQLSRFQFYRVMPAWQIFQELSMWVGGVLPQRDAMTARVSDADRFVERGFDAKTSFRNVARSANA